MMDRFTKWPEAIPLRGISAAQVAEALVTHWISRYGIPTIIVTDRGTQFESNLWHQLLQRLGVEWKHTNAWNPKANGVVERFHRDLKASFRSHADNNKNWKRDLPLILLGIRNSITEVNEMSPAQMVFGTTLSLPGDFFTNTSAIPSTYESLQSATSQFKHPTRFIRPSIKFHVPKEFHDCTHVWVRREIKQGLERPYEGPFKVLRKYEKFYDIENHGKTQRISLDRLKPAIKEIGNSFS